MWTDAVIVAQMRSAVQACLPKEAFLKRDRGDGVFVSNAPVFTPDSVKIPRFRTEQTGMLVRIYPDSYWAGQLEAMCVPAESDLCHSLERFRGIEPSAEAMALFCTGCKLLDAGKSALPTEIEAFGRNVRQLAAVVLRGGTNGGGLYALSLLDAMLKT